jgi:predicted GTPase
MFSKVDSNQGEFMDYINVPKFIKPNNPDSLGVLGTLIVLNKQIHSYELKVLQEYLNEVQIKMEETCLDGIIKGTDTSDSGEKYLNAYSGESPEVQLCLLYLLYVIANVDNNFDDNEKAYIDTILGITSIDIETAESLKNTAIERAGEIRSINNTLFVPELYEEKKTIWQRIIAFFVSLFNKLFKRDNKPLPDSDTDDAYRIAINRCSEIAAEDLRIIEPVYIKAQQKCRNTVESINEFKSKLSLKTELAAQVSQVIGCYTDVVNNEVSDQLAKEQYALEQKRRTVSDFTISLLGRTKAGKSTLHSILTREGKDMIGVGKQRTTRYNRVYQWNLLRIIDTPGIGSAEADGRKDEEIAESVLGESDIICFVVADDSILNDILEFIEKIALLNKPIIFLINHKDNIKPEVKFKRFIDSPYKWLNDGGESNLKGFEDRIRQFAEEKGFSNLIFIYPVFLLAASMARESEYAEYSKMLWDSSNIGEFIKQLSEWILKSGTIKRSQTLLDESVHVFDRAGRTITSAEKLLKDQLKHLNDEKKKSIASLDQAKDNVIANVSDAISTQFDDLANNRALSFAEEYINEGNKSYGKNLDEKWEIYRNRIEFEDCLLGEINKRYSEYGDKAQNITGELFENMYYSLNKSITLDDMKAPSKFDFKRFGNILFAGVGIAGFLLNFTGIGIVVTTALAVLNSIFTPSKEERKRKAIKNVYDHIREKTLEEKKIKLKENSDKLSIVMKKNTKKIEILYDDLISGIDWVKDRSDTLIKEYKKEVVELNRIYAWRILQFLEKRNEQPVLEEINEEIIGVDRRNPDVIRIITKSQHDVDTEELRTVIAEKIIFDMRKDGV